MRAGRRWAGAAWLGLVMVGLALAAAGAARAGVARLADRHEPTWLATINYWRAAAGLAAVRDQPSWDRGIENHLTYLQKTPTSYETGQYASAHTENPASPYYTRSGATEAGYSDLALGGATSGKAAIDGWLQAPFHAIGMLRAQLTEVAFADDPHTGYAGLDVIQGLDEDLPPATKPILYPGPGSTTTLATANPGEVPSPLQTCGWENKTAGLPLIVMLPRAPTRSLAATLTGPRGSESTAKRTLCVVDQNTYHSSNKVYGPTGAEILRDDNAVLLIPRRALLSGRYSVSMSERGQASIDWSFKAAI